MFPTIHDIKSDGGVERVPSITCARKRAYSARLTRGYQLLEGFMHYDRLPATYSHVISHCTIG